MTKTTKPLNNEQLIAKIMKHPNPLMHMFIFTALIKYADLVMASKPEDYANSMVHGESWIAMATELSTRIKERC